MFRGEKPRFEKKDEVHKALDLYESYLGKNEYMAANHLTLAGDNKYSKLLNALSILI